MIHSKIIGVGSPFGADRAGWDAIEYLQQQTELNSSQAIQFIALDRPGPALIDHFRDTQQVILIDAVKGEEKYKYKSEVDTIFEIDLNTIDHSSLTTSTHGLGVIEAIDLAKALNVLPPKLNIIGIETSESDNRCISEQKLRVLLEIIEKTLVKDKPSNEVVD